MKSFEQNAMFRAVLLSLAVVLPAWKPVSAGIAAGERFPRYVEMTNSCEFATNNLGGVTTSEYVTVTFETGDVVEGHVLLITNLVGTVTRMIPVPMTNEWGYLVTNQVNIASLEKQLSRDLFISADILTYDRDTGWVEAKGHVVVTRGSQTLRAVYGRMNIQTDDGYAAGDVIAQEGPDSWKGSELWFNVGQKWGRGKGGSAISAPFRFEGELGKETNNVYIAENVRLTTCTNEYPYCHYHIRAKKVTIEPETVMRGRSGKWYFSRVPVLYLPLWKLDLRDDFGWAVYPGHSSRLGFYALTSYKYRMSPVFRGKTHVDYMSERGVALGQDFKWGLTNGIPLVGLKTGAGNGDVAFYYLNDKKPIDDDEDIATSDIEETRYRIQLKNNYSLTQRDSSMLKANYLSDTDVLEDFFEDEFRIFNIPDNYLIFDHRGDEYSAGLSFRSRLNDFFGGVNRLPEASIDFMPQQIGESFFLYEGRTVAANLEQTYAANNTNDQEYSVFRFDTSHMVSRPQKYFGFLQVIPRAGYRGTYYSKTKETLYSEEILPFAVTNIVQNVSGASQSTVTTGTRTNAVTTILESPAEYRNVIELGTELSFKAFRQFGGDVKPRRHVIEPYMNYTYVPEPDLLPENVYSFDSVDSLDVDHNARIGLRNKWQKKQVRAIGHQPWDIVDLDVYTVCQIKRENNADPFQNIWADLEWMPSQYFTLNMDAQYDLTMSEVSSFNIRSAIASTNLFRSYLEFRYRPDDSSLFFGDLTLFPGALAWSPTVFARYDFELSRLEEAGFYLRRTLDCMVFRAGFRVMPGYARLDGTVQEDDYKVTVEFWLRAFPEFGMKRDDDGGYNRADLY